MALEGDFTIGDRYWAWDVGYTYAENQQLDITIGLQQGAALVQALGPSFDADPGAGFVPRCGTPAAPILNCVPLNIFGGPGSITQLSAKSDVSRQAITKHLRTLEGAGLVRSQRSGREVMWRLEAKRLAKVRRQLDLISEQWDRAIDRLRTFVEKDPQG